MKTTTCPHSASVTAIKTEIAAMLGYDPKTPPMQVSHLQAADVLGVKASTLAVWRSTGRYNIPFIKVGSLIRYRLSDLAEFIISRTQGKPASSNVRRQ